jgi:Ca2+-binding EF-hand superfamily protein
MTDSPPLSPSASTIIGGGKELSTTVQKLKRALEKWSAHRVQAIKGSPSALWDMFFEFCDDDKSGRLSFEEVDHGCRESLKCDLTRYEMRILWKFVDQDGSGLVDAKEWFQAMYKIELSMWPDFTDSQLVKVIFKINEAMEKWHKHGGNWSKMFSMMDSSADGSISYDDFESLVRGVTEPGLRLKKDVLPNRSLMGLWKGMDANATCAIKRGFFVSFMRRHMKAQGIDFHAKSSEPKSGTWLATKAHAENYDLGVVPQKTQEELNGSRLRLIDAVLKWFRREGRHVSSSNMWELFWEAIDVHGLRKMSYPELEKQMYEKLGSATGVKVDTIPQPTPDEFVLAKGITHGDLKALFVFADDDNSKVMSVKEWKLALYKIEQHTWKDADVDTLIRTVETLSWYANEAHGAGYNWFKIFRLMETRGADEKDQITFDVLKNFTYGQGNGCFGATQKGPKGLPLENLKALWKALDDDQSGGVSIQEFMTFMRSKTVDFITKGRTTDSRLPNRMCYSQSKNGAAHTRLEWKDTESKRVLGDQSVGRMADIKAMTKHYMKEQEADLLQSSFSGYTGDSLIQAYEAIGGSRSPSSPGETKSLTEWDFHPILRKVLKLPEDQLDDDAISAAWGHIDEEDAGQVDPDALVNRMRSIREAIKEKPVKVNHPTPHLKMKVPWGHTGAGLCNNLERGKPQDRCIGGRKVWRK